MPCPDRDPTPREHYAKALKPWSTGTLTTVLNILDGCNAPTFHASLRHPRRRLLPSTHFTTDAGNERDCSVQLVHVSVPSGAVRKSRTTRPASVALEIRKRCPSWNTCKRLFRINPAISLALTNGITGSSSPAMTSVG